MQIGLHREKSSSPSKTPFNLVRRALAGMRRRAGGEEQGDVRSILGGGCLW